MGLCFERRLGEGPPKRKLERKLGLQWRKPERERERETVKEKQR